MIPIDYARQLETMLLEQHVHLRDENCRVSVDRSKLPKTVGRPSHRFCIRKAGHTLPCRDQHGLPINPKLDPIIVNDEAPGTCKQCGQQWPCATIAKLRSLRDTLVAT